MRAHIRNAVTRIADVNTSIDNMTARINQAINDLELGRTYINKVNYGGSPESDYGNYASRGLSSAASDLNQAGGYVRELSSRLSISGAIGNYMAAADRYMAMYRKGKLKITKGVQWQEYAKV